MCHVQGELVRYQDIDKIELQARRGDNFLSFTLYLNFTELGHISATRCPTEMRFGSKCSILNGHVAIENQN